MKKQALVGLAVFLVAFCIAETASAATGYLSRRVNLRAGPGVEYPVVAVLGGGRSLYVDGCIQGWGWCEVYSGAYRGWVASDYLFLSHNKRRVRVIEAGPVVHLPIVSFQIGEYWDRHYRNKSFYRDRARWDRDYYWDRDRDHDRGRDNDRGRGRGRDDDDRWDNDHRRGWERNVRH